MQSLASIFFNPDFHPQSQASIALNSPTVRGRYFRKSTVSGQYFRKSSQWPVLENSDFEFDQRSEASISGNADFNPQSGSSLSGNLDFGLQSGASLFRKSRLRPMCFESQCVASETASLTWCQTASLRLWPTQRRRGWKRTTPTSRCGCRVSDASRLAFPLHVVFSLPSFGAHLWVQCDGDLCWV